MEKNAALYLLLTSSVCAAISACSFHWDDLDPRTAGNGGAGSTSSASETGSTTTTSTTSATTSTGTTTSSTGTSSTSSSSSSSTGGGSCMGPQDCVGLDDACNAGVCVNGMCTKMPANDGSACQSDACTVNAKCSSGACKGSPLDCSGFADACNSASCDPAMGCVKQAANNGAGCDDGQFCTTGDTCSNGACTGSPLVCPAPQNPCFVGVCDEAAKQCSSAPGNDGAACDDGNACTQATTCAGGNCTNGQAVSQCISGDGCCPAGCGGADSDCGPVLVGSYTIGQGQVWTNNPPTYTCQEACAAVFGGVAGQYSCSTSGASVDHQAWVDGWGDTSHCQGAAPVSESYKLNVNYNCGNFSCSFSAFVIDHCPSSTNYCWK